ncbi:NEL-type E3 ubiquitin ligase domain-containing protein [Pseudomonas atacamensis]|uniref:NEL-type E3 ubiquitin ligase domain-containing protein n=1 Tax=Pseudomonas atacamensis TaxID=2565368 RepID=UPI0037F6A228
MSADSDVSTISDGPLKPAASESLHAPWLEAVMPHWLIQAPVRRKIELKQAQTVFPHWYTKATPAQRQVVNTSYRMSFIAQARLDRSMSTFKDIDTFARPLLAQALKHRYQVTVDLDNTLLCLRRPIRAGMLGEEIGSFEALTLPMLQAALHNFESDECAYGAFHSSSGFATETAVKGAFKAVPVNVSVRNYLNLCRELDIGAKYQAYLTTFFHPVDQAAEAKLRRHFIVSQKTAMRAAAERALLTKDIQPEDHAMILSVINGERHPRIGDKQVWFQDLGLMRHRLVGCVVFKIAQKYRSPDAVILYVPNDPEHPLKRYTGTQMQDTFKRLLSARDTQQTNSTAPTSYQRFFSQFFPYEKRPYYFSQFVKSADGASDWLSSPWRKILQTTLIFVEIWKTSPKNEKMVPDTDPYVAVSLMPHLQVYPWARNNDLWAYLYEKHRDKVVNDARRHAVPTADVDAKARDAKLSGLLQFGLLALNMASMFVPVLGEIMLVVMTAQLLYETVEGVIEWSEGDKHAARAHLVDVAENLAQIGVMAAAGAVFSRVTAVKPEPVLEDLHPVTLPNGERRLWKPTFNGYEQEVMSGNWPQPDKLGQFRVDGKTWMRQGDKLYEQMFDRSTGQWRLKHPTDSLAYQPFLSHNGHGAWRLSLEQPMAWDRLTLLRRIGHLTDGYSDDTLLTLADISGISDDALRKMHMDQLPPPPELRDAMRLFDADAQARQMVEQLRGARPIDEHYLYAVPLITEMPRWPSDRVLEMTADPYGEGAPIRYGAQITLPGFSPKPPIRLTRTQVLNGEMPTRILAALDEQEINYLLGRKAAQLRPARPDEFSKQLAEYAYTRQPAIFDSLYRGSESLTAPVRVLQRECPGLSDEAAQDVIEHASAQELARMDAAGRSPLRMLEEARWHARHGRQTRAFAGLHSENLASADSRRLALHALEQLPGWPHSLRLEIREGSVTGTLLDSIGEPMAPVRRYLVKNGPFYQAFNDHAEALSRVSRVQDSFYSSLMHALPEDTRSSIGLSGGSAHGELQQKIIESAHLHRGEAARLLSPREKWFKPPVRVGSRLQGYYASGRGTGLNPSLESRIAHLYPDSRQARAFLARQRGRSEAQIQIELESRRQEWEALNVALERWQAAPSDSRTATHRAQLAQTLREAWRNGPLEGQVAQAARLTIHCDTTLPELGTSFPHVRELSITGIGMTDAHADGFLAAFPNVTDLRIGELRRYGQTPVARPLTTLPQTVVRLPGLRRLRFSTDAPLLAESFARRLGALTSLEELRIDYSGFDSTTLHGLDLESLTRLRRLRIDAPHALWRWPAYVERLQQLRRLDLTHTLIETLPDSLYNGNERLWAGLSLDWSRVTPATFRRAYEYVSRYSGPRGRLLDVHQMVSEYCRAELDTMAVVPDSADPLPQAFNAAWSIPSGRLAAIEQLRAEHEAIFAAFYPPSLRQGSRYAAPARRWSTGANADILQALKSSWHGSIRQRYGLAANVERFAFVELPDATTRVELPSLPAGSFAHVRTLRLGGLNVSSGQARSFVRAFSHIETLELGGSTFTELPFAAQELPALRRLDVSGNRITVTATVQRQLDALPHLVRLNLSNNPVGHLDATALSGLQALNLRSTDLQAWPTGAESLPRLSWLDLRDNRIASLSPQALAHPDALMRTNLSGNAFSAEGEAAFHAALQRIEQQRGLGEGTLARFAAEPVPEYFPPLETGGSFSDLLLPLPQPAPITPGSSGASGHLQRLTVILNRDRAQRSLLVLQARALNDAQIDAQISEWHLSCEALTRQLNDWLYTREVRTNTLLISAQVRSLVARRISETWLDTLTERPGSAGLELQLSGLQTGELPALVVQFPGVTTLDLSGAGITARGSAGFLAGFPDLDTLFLGGNELGAVPAPVLRMRHLTRLEMQYCSLRSATSVYPLLGNAQLRTLDLSYNELRVFNPPDYGVIESLDLRYNQLSEWPDGVLRAPGLRELNLCGNEITDIPRALFADDHSGLIAGSDLSENRRLSLSALQDLRRYSREHSAPYVLGMTRGQIEAMIERLVFGDLLGIPESGVAIDNAGSVVHDPHAQVFPAEDVFDPANDVAPRSRDPWLADSDPQRVAQRTELWAQLAQEPNHERFFQLLRLLLDTQDYLQVRGELRERVWRVMQAAAENTELRQLLFEGAETHGTCPDGRILTFSDMEVRVAVYHQLRDIPLNRMAPRGRALLRLSRQLFRLDRVETLAEAAALGMDRAEVRLKYRIGLTSGWGDGVDLPGQPASMTYDVPLSDELLEYTRASILEAEATDALSLSMAERDYWITYLQDLHPQEMAALEAAVDERRQQLWDQLNQRFARNELNTAQYNLELNRLGKAMDVLRTQKRAELTRRVINELQNFAAESEQPGRLSPASGS